MATIDGSQQPQTIADATHSIQNVPESETDENVGEEEERTPLLHRRRPTCVRNLWVCFFSVFLFVGFTAGAYLLLTEEAEWPIIENSHSYKTKKDGHLPGTANMLKLQVPVEKVLLTKTNSPECKENCSREIHKIQGELLTVLQKPDIGYNFLIAGDGQTYKGRGWDYQAMVFNSGDNSTLIIAFLGVFNTSLPSKKQLNQAKDFLEESESKGKLTPCYSIHGDRNLNPKFNLFMDAVLYLQGYFKLRRKNC